jgi:hypothetical protein
MPTERVSLVAHGLECEGLRRGGFFSEDAQDRLERAARLRSEKGEGDVKARDAPTSGEMASGPRVESGHDLRRELESEKEPESVISLDGTACGHVDVCRLSNNRRTR